VNKLLMTTTLLAAFGATPAKATLDISFTDGTHVFTCADQTSCDLDGAAKNLLLINTMVGDFRVEGTFASSSAGAINNLQVSNLTIFNEGATAGSLTMVVGDTSFAVPVESIRESASLTFNEDVGEPSTLAFFASKLNTQPGGDPIVIPGTSLFSVSGSASVSPQSFSGNHDSPFSTLLPFSMTETATLGMLPGSTITGFNQSMTSGVPEPSTWAMLAIGFGFLGFTAIRRGRTRLAI
jgi:PEP-CTERM motif